MRASAQACTRMHAANAACTCAAAQVKQQEWEDVCAHLKGLGSKDASTPPDQWQRRAKDAEYQLLRLCNTLLGLPDPLPFLEVTSSLSSKLAGARTAGGTCVARVRSGGTGAHAQMDQHPAPCERLRAACACCMQSWSSATGSWKQRLQRRRPIPMRCPRLLSSTGP